MLCFVVSAAASSDSSKAQVHPSHLTSSSSPKHKSLRSRSSPSRTRGKRLVEEREPTANKIRGEKREASVFFFFFSFFFFWFRLQFRPSQSSPSHKFPVATTSFPHSAFRVPHPASPEGNYLRHGTSYPRTLIPCVAAFGLPVRPKVAFAKQATTLRITLRTTLLDLLADRFGSFRVSVWCFRYEDVGSDAFFQRRLYNPPTFLIPPPTALPNLPVRPS